MPAIPHEVMAQFCYVGWIQVSGPANAKYLLPVQKYKKINA